MEGIKWTWNFDVYDESDAPTEEGYYRIIDDEGNEMTDYYFNELVMTQNGLSYWRNVGRPIIAWRFLGKTELQTRTDEDGGVWEYRNGNWWQDVADDLGRA